MIPTAQSLTVVGLELEFSVSPDRVQVSAHRLEVVVAVILGSASQNLPNHPSLEPSGFCQKVAFSDRLSAGV